MAKKQVHAYYSGKVQGVGFRFTVLDIARNLAVLGWVKNLPDGRVEVVAEADQDILENFLGMINKSFDSYIREAGIKWLNVSGVFNEFEIRH